MSDVVLVWSTGLPMVLENIKFSVGENLRAWVFRVAHNLAMNHHRSQKRRQMSNEIEVHLVLHEPVDPFPDPEQKILNKERAPRLQSALSREGLPATAGESPALPRNRARHGVSAQWVGELTQSAISRVELGRKVGRLKVRRLTEQNGR